MKYKRRGCDLLSDVSIRNVDHTEFKKEQERVKYLEKTAKQRKRNEVKEAELTRKKNLWELNGRKERQEELRSRISNDEYERIFGKKYNAEHKKGNYRITHPEPFDFAKHIIPYSKKKSFLNWLERITTEREEKELTHKIVPRSIPKSTYEPIYERMQEKEKQREERKNEWQA